ncbi:MAG: peptide chain release factor 3 [Vampirovibrionales bacterium]|nr:peptide chain release factor 3 [Vampirovibrionales bacterium]
MTYATEVACRRTFAIISHPDAGKTTLTEKLLLYGGAVNLAGSVTAKKQQRQTSSDWMAIEKQRGISISSTVLNFEYGGYQINLLDTPGHKDFAEDTYRTLMAADSVIMLIDNAKGVEAQTKELFKVCRLRNIPVVTFINKMDREGRGPLELLDEVESIFNIKPCAFNWPLGSGERFKGVYDRRKHQLHTFERTAHGAYKAPVDVMARHDAEFEAFLASQGADLAVIKEFEDEIDILDGVGHEYSHEEYLNGQLTPVFFGSAANNFGVQLFLDTFLPLAPAPRPRDCENNGLIAPESDDFSAYVFKIQANMNPSHRDCMTFVRICSGQFEKDMVVQHTPTGKSVRLTHAHKLFGQDRDTHTEGFAGDVIGLTSNQGVFSIGDTIYSGNPKKPVQFGGVPTFSPKVFAGIYNPNTAKYKQFTKGLEQLGREGAIQIITLQESGDFGGGYENQILAAMGQLQFEVVQHRLEHEYGVITRLTPMPEFTHARWLDDDDEVLAKVKGLHNAKPARDSENRPMLLFKGEWALNHALQTQPDLSLYETPPNQRLG